MNKIIIIVILFCSFLFAQNDNNIRNLMSAVEMDDVDTVEYIISSKLANIEDKDLYDGNTALINAAYSGSINTLNYLIRNSKKKFRLY